MIIVVEIYISEASRPAIYQKKIRSKVEILINLGRLQPRTQKRQLVLPMIKYHVKQHPIKNTASGINGRTTNGPRKHQISVVHGRPLFFFFDSVFQHHRTSYTLLRIPPGCTKVSCCDARRSGGEEEDTSLPPSIHRSLLVTRERQARNVCNYYRYSACCSSFFSLLRGGIFPSFQLIDVWNLQLHYFHAIVNHPLLSQNFRPTDRETREHLHTEKSPARSNPYECHVLVHSATKPPSARLSSKPVPGILVCFFVPRHVSWKAQSRAAQSFRLKLTSRNNFFLFFLVTSITKIPAEKKPTATIICTSKSTIAAERTS